MKFKCECGNNIYDQLIPNPISYRIIADTILVELGDRIDADALFDRASQMLRCDQCGRLWVIWRGGDGKLQEYAPFHLEGQIGERPGARPESQK